MKKAGSEKQMLSVVFVYKSLTPACKAFLFYATVIFILALLSTPGFLNVYCLECSMMTKIKMERNRLVG